MFDRFGVSLGVFGVDLRWIWGVSGKYLGGILALVRTSSVDLEVSGVELGSIWPSCALPPSAKIYRKSIEHLSKIYRTSIEHLSTNLYMYLSGGATPATVLKGGGDPPGALPLPPDM